MALVATNLVGAPAAEPLTLAEARAHLRVVHDFEDSYIAGLVSTARQTVEDATGRKLVTQTWDIWHDRFPPVSIMRLGWPLCSAVSAFEYTDVAGTTTAWTVSGTTLSAGGAAQARIDSGTQSLPAAIILADSREWPSASLATHRPIRIRATFGYGADGSAVPPGIKHAMYLLIDHFYWNRGGEPMADGICAAVEALLSAHRVTDLFLEAS